MRIHPGTLGALLAVATIPGIADAQMPPRIPGVDELTDIALASLSGNSINVGVSYTQATFKARKSGGKTQITDNGSFAPVVEFAGSERSLKAWPLRSGQAVLGWNFKATLGHFDTQYQILDSAFRGRDVGTGADGWYAGAAPSLFLKLGPLYPDRAIFWKLTYGVGAGLLKADGEGQFPDGSVQRVGGSSPRLALYQDAALQLQVDRWQFEFTGKLLNRSDAERTSLESYGFAVSWRFAF